MAGGAIRKVPLAIFIVCFCLFLSPGRNSGPFLKSPTKPPTVGSFRTYKVLTFSGFSNAFRGDKSRPHAFNSSSMSMIRDDAMSSVGFDLFLPPFKPWKRFNMLPESVAVCLSKEPNQTEALADPGAIVGENND